MLLAVDKMKTVCLGTSFQYVYNQNCQHQSKERDILFKVREPDKIKRTINRFAAVDPQEIPLILPNAWCPNKQGIYIL